jgi:hypothetical protein
MSHGAKALYSANTCSITVSVFLFDLGRGGFYEREGTGTFFTDQPRPEGRCFMTRRFSSYLPSVGARLPANVFGRLVGQFQFASHVPLRGGRDTGRHIYLSLNVPAGPSAGIFECAVNIRSDENTNVLYTHRIENLDAGTIPELGFQGGIKLSYGSGGNSSDASFLGLRDGDFESIVNDKLYNQIADLSQNCDRIAVYGVTYDTGDGIHDVHMNSGTDPADGHASQDR